MVAFQERVLLSVYFQFKEVQKWPCIHKRLLVSGLALSLKTPVDDPWGRKEPGVTAGDGRSHPGGHVLAGVLNMTGGHVSQYSGAAGKETLLFKAL